MITTRQIPQLEHIPYPPRYLYIRGKIPCGKKMIAVIGSRKASPYGVMVTKKLVTDFVRRGCVIVSGLAFGIDAAAHKAALDAHGITIAFLPGGVDNRMITPGSNRSLAAAILQNDGALLSEYASGTSARKEHFYARNRLISGISDCLVIIEAGEKSGTLITARHALDQGKDIFVVPGPVYNACHIGSNRLIQQGAHPLLQSRDVLEHLGISTQNTQKMLSSDDQKLYSALLRHITSSPIHIQDIAKKTKLPMQEILAQLTALELAGAIRDVGNRSFIREI